MSPRPYRLGRRAEGVEQTRDRILAATRHLLVRGDYRSTSLDEIARTADVARATVYYQFGSKGGLLEALVADIERRAGQAAVHDAVEVTDPTDALHQAFLAGCRFWAAEHPLVRRLTGLAAVDSDIEHVIAEVQQHRLPLLTHLVERLDAAGRLSPSSPPARALDILWMLSSFEAFDQLFAGRGLPVDDVAEILAGVAVHALLVEPDRQTDLTDPKRG
jgi:AcrR family transcriptional regulator